MAPIMAFVPSDEHIVANMFFIPVRNIPEWSKLDSSYKQHDPY
jgi:hypothetical protein